MENLGKPPQWLLNSLPEGVRPLLEGSGWYIVLALLGLLVLLILFAVVRSLFGKSRPKKDKTDLRIDLTAIPAPPPSTGDRRLTIEGTPVRLRLVVVAPAGRAYDINPEAIQALLNRVLPGLGDIAERDKPHVLIWPFQLSYEGFANQFHSNTPLPEGEDEPSRWVLAAGRAHLGSNQVLLGLGLLAVKPTTIGRRRVEMHDWPNVLRIRTKD